MSIIIADIWQWTPFIFILALAALQSLPKSTIEAARIDGATGWQQIWHVKLPLMMPVLIVTCLLCLIDAFKVLEVVLVLTNGGPGLSTEIMALRIARTASEFRELGKAAAMSKYLLLLLMALTLAMFLYGKFKPNGLAFSPDEDLLYVVDTGATHDDTLPVTIHAYPVMADRRSRGEARLFATCPDGFFDGVRVDRAGHLWASAGRSVFCYAPDGTHLGTIVINALVANICFGGARRNRLYICGQTSLYAIFLNTRASR